MVISVEANYLSKLTIYLSKLTIYLSSWTVKFEMDKLLVSQSSQLWAAQDICSMRCVYHSVSQLL